jgi:hypothetical protein
VGVQWKILTPDRELAMNPFHDCSHAGMKAHRAPDPAPVEEPVPEPRPHPYPAHPVPQTDPVPDHNPS